MSAHDPMCLGEQPTDLNPSFARFCDCNRVAKIRADERRTIADWLDRQADIITDAGTYITDDDVRGYADEIRGED